MKPLSTMADLYSSFARKGKILPGGLLLATVLGLGARVLLAQKPSSLPSDLESPRLDSIPSKMHPTAIDLQRTTSARPKTNAQDYIISPDDELAVDVLDVPELTRTYRVSPTGVITVPLLTKPVVAAGLTLVQLGQSLEEQLRSAGMVAHANVTVRVTKSRLHAIAIAGAVKAPQMYEIYSKTTVLDALAQAQGLAEDAGNTAIITRGDMAAHADESDPGAGNKPAGALAKPGTVHVDLKALLEDGDTSQNFELYPGDSLSVQRAGIFYVVGAVNKPGGFILKDDRQQMTLLKALALAEYTKTSAAVKRTVIVRRSPTVAGGSHEIPVELDKILERRAEDRVLLAGDILFIPESGSKKALMRAAEIAASGATVLFYRIP